MSRAALHSIVQTLVVRNDGKILLGRWLRGSLAGRFTGLLGAARETEHPQHAAVRVAASLVPGLSLKAAQLRPRAIFDFHEVPTLEEYREGVRGTESTTELQYVYRLHDDEVEAVSQIGGSGGGGGGGDSDGSGDNTSLEPQWFPLADIPYDQMPADDPLWYPLVLDPRGPCLTGEFRFRREELLSHQMEEISPDALADRIAQALG